MEICLNSDGATSAFHANTPRLIRECLENHYHMAIWGWRFFGGKVMLPPRDCRLHPTVSHNDVLLGERGLLRFGSLFLLVVPCEPHNMLQFAIKSIRQFVVLSCLHYQDPCQYSDHKVIYNDSHCHSTNEPTHSILPTKPIAMRWKSSHSQPTLAFIKAICMGA